MKITRLVMGARALVWPWCAVLAAALLARLPLSELRALLLGNAPLLGVWLGVPLLAALVLGREFQFGTWVLLLSQPVNRRTIWLEKSTLIGIATISVPLMYGVLLPRPMRTVEFMVIGFLWAIISTSSAVFWTLIARSTIGGFVLIQSQLILLLPFIFVNLGEKNGLLAVSVSANTIGISVATGYAVLMFWLGRKKFLGFQVTGSGSAGDMIKSDPGRWAPVRRIFRCSPAEPRLNLFRKEIHLLWPLWLSTGLAVAFVVLVTPFSRMADKAHWNWATEFAIGVALYSVLAGLLAGSLSIGEERTSGTLAFHSTLPVPMLVQWRIKLITALSSSLICVLLVCGVARFLLGQHFVVEFGKVLLGPGGLLLSAAGFTFATFWCAAAVRGTVRAVSWSIPAVVVVVLAFDIGRYAGFEGSYNSRLLGWAIAKVHPFPFTDATDHILWGVAESRLIITIPLALLLVVAAVQCFRLFRVEPNDRALPIVRHLSVLTAIAFVGGFCQQLPSAVSSRTFKDTRAVLEEAARAVSATKLDLDRASPTGLGLSVEDLARNIQLSALTRSWLARSSIQLVPREFTFPAPPMFPPFYHYHFVMSVNLEGAWSCDIAIPEQNHLFYYCHLSGKGYQFPY